MAEPIISVSGLRGIVGETLTAEVAVRYTTAFAAIAPPGDIFIGRDSRPSGEMLSQAIQAGLQAVGRNTIDGGIMATPTVGVQVMTCRAVGGIQITASHNPSPYNGLKLFSAKGRVIPSGLGKQVLERYRAAKPGRVEKGKSGIGSSCEDAIGEHLSAVLEIVDPQRIRRRRFRVVLDSNHGAGGILGRRLLDELGCDATILGEEPSGEFAHTPEPIAENLVGVLKALPEARGYWLLSGSGCRSACCYRRNRSIHRRGIYNRPLRRSYSAASEGADRDELLEQPDVTGSGRKIRRAVLSFGGG